MNTRPRLFVLTAALAGAMTIFMTGCNKPPQTTGAPVASTTVGTELDDTVVTTRVKAALVKDPSVKGFDFKVETRKGEVQLSGFVDSQEQVDHAIAVTRAVEGVKGIDNKVSLKGAAT
ncbi:MAG: BON domain-containing protein, partial [Betaproteobacteria bacterium]|nr:BON domain-containing protein [Betaproteobacteria bacterium]